MRGPGIPLSGPVLVFGEDGTYHRSWGHNVVDMIHGMRLQRLANGTARIWVTDLGNGAMGHTVKMFSTDGDLLETIGTPGKAGVSLNPIQFDQVRCMNEIVCCSCTISLFTKSFLFLFIVH